MSRTNQRLINDIIASYNVAEMKLDRKTQSSLTAAQATTMNSYISAHESPQRFVKN